MRDLQGRTALVTGASRGIGATIAETLAREGMHLMLSARSREALDRTAARLQTPDQRVHCIPANLGDRAALEALVREAEERGPVDVLVNNAALEQAFPYDEFPRESIDTILEVDLRAPMMLTRLLLPGMIGRGRGHIVNVSSMGGLVGTPYNESYSAAKHGLMGFTRSLRLSLQADGHDVGVSAICPGFVSRAGMYVDAQREFGMQAPTSLGRASPRDVAEAVVRAIRTNAPEPIVNSRPLRQVAVLAAALPRIAERVAQSTGLVEAFGSLARERLRRSRRPGAIGSDSADHEQTEA